jgi:hypothetical protein
MRQSGSGSEGQDVGSATPCVRFTMWRVFGLVLSLLLLLCATKTPANANTPGVVYVSLNWTMSSCSPACTYNMYRSTGTGTNPCAGTPTPLASSISATAYSDTTVAAGTTYVYAVTAVSGGAESACSSSVQIAVPSLPPAPVGLQGVAS